MATAINFPYTVQYVSARQDWQGRPEHLETVAGFVDFGTAEHFAKERHARLNTMETKWTVRVWDEETRTIAAAFAAPIATA